MTFIPPPFLRIKKAAAAPAETGSRGGFFDTNDWVRKNGHDAMEPGLQEICN